MCRALNRTGYTIVGHCAQLISTSEYGIRMNVLTSAGVCASLNVRLILRLVSVHPLVRIRRLLFRKLKRVFWSAVLRTLLVIYTHRSPQALWMTSCPVRVTQSRCLLCTPRSLRRSPVAALSLRCVKSVLFPTGVTLTPIPPPIITRRVVLRLLIPRWMIPCTRIRVRRKRTRIIICVSLRMKVITCLQVLRLVWIKVT